MTKRAFDKIAAGLTDAIDIAQGKAKNSTHKIHVPTDVDVRAIREKLGLTQAEFAGTFGFSVGSVRDWEQRRNRPETTARVLLTVIDRKPEAVREALEIV